MKATRLEGLRYWSEFQPDRGIDFNGFAWRRPNGKTVLIDPMPMSDTQIESCGDVDWILLTNADHLRAATEITARLGASIAAPEGDRDQLADVAVAAWYSAEHPLPPTLSDVIDVHWIHGGKTPAEAALVLKPLGAVLFGDAVRSHVSGVLRLLPEEKMRDADIVWKDLAALTKLDVDAVLLGDGDCVFVGAGEALNALAASQSVGRS